MFKAAYTFLVVLVLAVPAAAEAKCGTKTLAPPGNSAVNQYVETVPTAKGGCPTSTIPRAGTHGSGAISPGTSHALSALGSNGRGAAAFADATGTAKTDAAKARTSRGHRRSSHGQAAPGGSSGGNGGNNSGNGGSPASAVIKTLSGSGGGGGLGVLLPIILAALAIGAAGIAVTRRRTA